MNSPEALTAALVEAAVLWKRNDQPEKPVAVVRRWAERYIDALRAALAATEGG